MDYLMDVFTYTSNYFSKRIDLKKEIRDEKKVTKYEIYFEHMYKILSWEDITLTLVIFLIFNFGFWIIVQWEIKMFGLFFFTLLIIFICNFYLETRDLTLYETKYRGAFDEICMYTYEVIQNWKTLRIKSPSWFCIGMCLIYLFMGYLGTSISGYIAAYFMLLGIFFVPLGFKCLPDEYAEIIIKFAKSLNNVKGVLEEEEFIPFITEDPSNKDADLDCSLTDRTIDSKSNSLVSLVSSMPSYLDIAEMQRDIEEEDLLPTQDNNRGLHTPDDLSSDSDSDGRGINFESSQFEGDSSSEEEHLLGRDLKFTEDTDGNKKQKSLGDAGLTGALSNFATAGGSLVANLFKKSPVPIESRKYENSSDSEFEMVNSEDLK